MQETVSFSVNIRGESSGHDYSGTFKVRTKTSFRDRIREDEVRRTILGANPEGVTPYVSAVAAALAYLGVRVVESPSWWKEADNGLTLEDDNILTEVNNRTVAAIQAERDTVIKEADAAQVVLRQAAAEAK